MKKELQNKKGKRYYNCQIYKNINFKPYKLKTMSIFYSTRFDHLDWTLRRLYVLDTNTEEIAQNVAQRDKGIF